MDKCFTSYAIEDRSFVAFVKRDLHNQLLHSKFNKNRIAEIDIIISELTSNLIKHAGSGELLCRLSDKEDGSMLEILTIDNGPGMADVHRMMKDGVSTSNTLGQGLGAIQRLSTGFQIYSMPKWGTVTYTWIDTAEKKRKRQINDVEVRGLCVPLGHEVQCGDAYAVTKTRNHVKIMLADGLGHGKHAHEAVATAHEAFVRTDELQPVEIIRHIHQQVRKTRGLVASVAVLDLKNREWKICGVGNISTRLYGGIMFKHYTSYNGIVGLNIPNTLNETVVPAEKNQQLVMCSDGIRSRWDLSRYPSILKNDMMLVAGALFKDYTRRTDDASIFIGKVIFDR